MSATPEAPAEPAAPAARKKVVILGGGAAAMAAAYSLSSTQDLRDRLEVTVYQLGWRLGGKGASGRNAELFERTEEHGLHVWGGFYYNAFRVVQDVYAALDRPLECPLRHWSDAFQPHNLVTWEEQIEGKWIHWPVEPPANDGVPGQGSDFPTVWEFIEMMVGWIRDLIFVFPHSQVRDAAAGATDHAIATSGLAAQVAAADPALADRMAGPPNKTLEAAHELAGSLARREGFLHRAVEHVALLALLAGFHRWLESEWLDEILEDNEARRVYILADCLQAMIRGIIRDGVFTHGYMAIDGFDFAEWLGRHGASPLALESAPLRGYYDYFFAYEKGDPGRPRMSAGMGLVHLLRLIGCYKGGLFWKMAAGMGDAVFAPLYEICSRNGVRFEFFHRVADLVPSAEGRSIEKIVLKRQVDLAKPGAEYAPLVYPSNVPSWPDAPLADQIDPAQARALAERDANLEDPWTNWDDVGTVELSAGADFDAAVLGISIGAFPSICARLIASNPDWKAMVENLQTIQTQALQLWWKPTAQQLGWEMGNATGTGYGQPLESWSDMSDALPREEWPAGEKPGFVVYFCGPMMTPPETPAGKDPSFGADQTEKAWTNAAAWCGQFIGHLYPEGVEAADPSQLRWDLLADPASGSGPARLRNQYARANYTPSERYVLDLPGTNRYRLEADTSGYDNLALAGDWIFTGLGGAVEAAVMAGLQAARALAGVPKEIPGEMPSPWRRPRSLKNLL